MQPWKHVQKLNHMTIFSMHDFIISIVDYDSVFSLEIFGTRKKVIKILSNGCIYS